MRKPQTARLILEDGTEYRGYAFGAQKPAAGEVVFNTAMTGYPESLTDPSFYGQILVFTYPLIGNYGIPEFSVKNGIPDHFESDRIHVRGIVVQEYVDTYSHWGAMRSLAEWMEESGVPGIGGVDTRALTRKLREKGTMLGKIVYEERSEIDFYDPNQENLVEKVSTRTVQRYGDGSTEIVLVDCGVKYNIIRSLLKRGVSVVRVPWDYDPTAIPCDGVVVSNGPGNPALVDKTVENLQKVLEAGVPLFGICLGNQLLARAAGASTYKLKYGHRGHNQPVMQPSTHRCYITPQNHGYAVDMESLSPEWQVSFVNIHDGSCEGIRHQFKPMFSVQFHPEAAGGPVDTEFLFDEFLQMVNFYKRR